MPPPAAAPPYDDRALAPLEMPRSVDVAARVEAAAVRVALDAARGSSGYRRHLREHGVAPERITRLTEIPYTDKETVFGGDVQDWLVGGTVTAAAELLTSSGQSGLFSLGVVSGAERRQQQAVIDAALRRLGAGETTSTLLINCLPMGISLPTRLATVAVPSVHVEMAVEILTGVGRAFDRIVLVAEPLMAKQVAESALVAAGSGWADRLAAIVVGGEWVAESWRTHVSHLAGQSDGRLNRGAGVLVSMGAAELGLNVLAETPELREARRAIDPGGRRALFGGDPGYTPTLFTYEPDRVMIEERRHADGSRTLAVTPLGRRMLPLVRYDLGDLGEFVPAAQLNRELAARGCAARVADPVVAVWGRRGASVSGTGWSLRPEIVKERIFATDDRAACLTGRFSIEVEGGRPALHVQLRPGTAPSTGLERELGRFMSTATGAMARAVAHPHGAYPFHAAGDLQRKPRYHSGLTT